LSELYSCVLENQYIRKIYEKATEAGGHKNEPPQKKAVLRMALVSADLTILCCYTTVNSI
jgi:hypothetical protein